MVPAKVQARSQLRASVYILNLFAALEAKGQSTYKEIDVRDGGRIAGRVILKASGVNSLTFDVTKDSDDCGLAKNSHRLVVGRHRGVKDAIVSIEQITEGKKFNKFIKPVLDQRKCEYVPHVQVLPAGTPLEIVNSDDILHNVHAYLSEESSRTVFNVAQPIKGQKTTIKQSQLSKPGLLYLTCDAGHPWMTAYILLAEHPYYAITDESGAFELTNVPAGTYTVRMWKEGFRVVDTEMEKGKVKKYHFEEPYKETKDLTIKANEKIYIEFQLVPGGGT